MIEIDELSVDTCEADNEIDDSFNTSDDKEVSDGETELNDEMDFDGNNVDINEFNDGSPRPSNGLSRYEQIRLDIIEERNKLIAESGVLQSILETKEELNRGKGKKAKVSNKKKQNETKSLSL